jgi:uncharacterized protein YdeI (BOF family)
VDMKTIIISLTVILAFTFLGCSVERYGTKIDKSISKVKVKDLFLDTNIVGKSVSLEGKIVSQCGSNGCWFVLRDDTGQIFINLAPRNLTLPPRMNMSAKVTGTVNIVQGQLQVFAEGIEIR